MGRGLRCTEGGGRYGGAGLFRVDFGGPEMVQGRWRLVYFVNAVEYNPRVIVLNSQS